MCNGNLTENNWLLNFWHIWDTLLTYTWLRLEIVQLTQCGQLLIIAFHLILSQFWIAHAGRALEGYLGYLRIPQYFWTNSMNFSKKFQSFMYLVCYTGYFDLRLTCWSNNAILLWQKNDLLVELVLFADNLITF